jgi:hypothetical protein
MDNLMRLLVPNRTPPGGVVRSVGVLPTTAPQAVAPVGIAPPAAPAAPQLSPTAKYIADMQALMSGGIGQLSTGEKISALGQVLQAAGSRGASDPAAVLQGVRNQQMQKLNAQYQIAQLQQAQQEAAQQRAAIEKYKIALEPDEINALEGLPLEKQAEKVAEIAFRQKQLFSRDRDPVTGNVRLTYSGGDTIVTDEKMPANTREIDVGDAVEIYDKDTNRLIMSVPKRMNAYQIASLAREDRREARIARGGSSSGGAANLPQPTVKIINGKPTNVQWDKRRQKYVPFNQPGLGIPNKGDILATNLAPEVAALLSGIGGVE